ncbi:MAG: GNAT family N-acetyltransferase [Bdellovibrionales bacterium]|jgi:predicted GNAT family N-acyltransferase|nr:GNAT family N-acetyltransferase [Bdellovibrionales bacterium]
MSLQSEIKLIQLGEAITLRQKVLRPLARVDDCIFPNDNDSSTFHLGLFHNQKLVSVASLMQESSPYFSAGFPFRLRGMATAEHYRGQGLGSKLLGFGIFLLKERRCDLLWCNARFRSFSFYRSMGFQFYGDLFDIKDSGPHKVMYKVIIPR